MKILKLAMIFPFVLLLFPVSIFAGEIIEAECTGGSGSESKTLFVLLDTDGGKTNLMGEEVDLLITNDKAIMTIENEPGQVIIDFKSGNLIANGQKAALCKFSNLDALKMENTEDTEDTASDILEIEQKKTSILDGISEYKEAEIIQLLESMKTQLEKIETKLDALNAQENKNTVDDVTEVKEVEIIEATCDAGMEVALFFIRNDGGTQYVDFFEENAEITFTKDKVLMRLESSGLMVIDFKSGDLFIGGEKQADCKFSNLEALR